MKDKLDKYEHHCVALDKSHGQRLCVICLEECFERTRYECNLWRKYVQSPHQKENHQSLEKRKMEYENEGI